MRMVGLLALTLESRSTKPGMLRTFSITPKARRSSSRWSGPCKENSTCLLPPTESSRPTWVTVMPGTLFSRSRRMPDIWSTLR